MFTIQVEVGAPEDHRDAIRNAIKQVVKEGLAQRMDDLLFEVTGFEVDYAVTSILVTEHLDAEAN